MIITTKNHLTYVDGKQTDYRATPNKSGTITPEFVVLHDTASGLKSDGDISWLTDPASNVSAHCVIARDGKITQLAPWNARCWHAGQSKWDGRANVNGFAIGIEIDNPGRLQRIAEGVYSGVATFNAVDAGVQIAPASTTAHGAGYWMAYTDAQIETVIGLCRALVGRYPTIRGIITHWLISPGRKVDTNPLFPLEQVRNKVFGMQDPAPQAAPKPGEVIASPAFVPDATVTASSLNLRAMPNGEIIGALRNGERVDVREVDRESGWSNVAAEGGKTGYVYTKFLRLDGVT